MALLEGLDRALRVLGALGEAGAPGLPLGELSARVGLHKPVVHRILATLRARGFAVQDAATSHYALGPGFLAIADGYLGEDNLREILHAAAYEVGNSVNELVHVAVPEQLGVRLIDKVEPRHALRIWSRIGDVYSLADSPLGHALMSVNLRTRADVVGVFGHTSHSIDHLWSIVQTTRARGWAELLDADAGTASVAVAVVRQDRAVAALSSTMPQTRLADQVSAGEVARVIREALERHLPPGLAVFSPTAALTPAAAPAASAPARPRRP